MPEIDRSPPPSSLGNYEEDRSGAFTHAIITVSVDTRSVWIRRIAATPWHEASARRAVAILEKRP